MTPVARNEEAIVGTMALEDSARVDFARLRRQRRLRLFDALAAEGMDALVLGRPANVRYASGARQLWRAGSAPFGPACVVVRETKRVHLLSAWDEGVQVWPQVAPPWVTIPSSFGPRGRTHQPNAC